MTTEPRPLHLGRRLLLENIIVVAERLLGRTLKRGVQVRHVLLIGFSDEPAITLDGRTVLEHCTFRQWHTLSPALQQQMIREGVVVAQSDTALPYGAGTREAALDSLALKLARWRTPKVSFWKAMELERERFRRDRAARLAELEEDIQADLDEVEPTQ